MCSYIAASLGNGLAHGASETWFSGFWLGRGFEKASCFGRVVRLVSAAQSNRWTALREASPLSLTVFCGLESFGFLSCEMAEKPG